MYELKGNEKREESKVQKSFGEVVTVKYFNGDKLVRQDVVVNVNTGTLSKTIQGAVK